MRATHAEIFPAQKKATTPEQQIAATGRVLDRAIDQLAGDLKEGKLGRKSIVRRASTPEIEAKRAQLDALRVQREELRANDPAYQKDTEARQTAAYKRNLTRRMADLQSRAGRDGAVG